ncbi:MAG: signal transduction histidine kinase [Acidimicrobiales bacterium]|jgi:signal transduction histidine kinase
MMQRFESIRFRLSLGLALAVFAMGSFMIGGIYLWQVNQLDEPVLVSRPLVLQDATTGETYETDIDVVFGEEVQRVALARFEQQSYRRALNQLRRASFGGLFALFFASFGAGWLLSGWTLKPIERINSVARDITATDLSRRIALRGPNDELKRLGDTFDDMLDRLEDAFEEQRRFVHEASHELRNPLAVARTNLEVAIAGDDEAALRRSAKIALGSTERMSLLVEDLLEQARRGVPELTRRPVDVRQLVADRVVDFRAAAEARGIAIVAPLPAGDLLVHGDSPALSRALSNLLANAVRLAPVGSTVTVSAERVGDWVDLLVADEGPGIDPQYHQAIFDRFWRGDDDGAGSGLGLSIVRRVAERHGGWATVTSAFGDGSVFRVRLPVPLASLSSEVHPRP